MEQTEEVNCFEASNAKNSGFLTFSIAYVIISKRNLSKLQQRIVKIITPMLYFLYFTIFILLKLLLIKLNIIFFSKF